MRDDQGCDALIDRYAPMVFNRCRRSLGAADADDATQAVFLVLARKQAQAPDGPALASWLLTVADHVIRHAQRDRTRRRHHEASAPRPAPIVEEAAMDDIREHLDACLAQLPATEREAVRMHHLGGHTLVEIAAQTGVPVSTLHDRIQRGLERLRALLGRRGVHTASAVALLACLQAEANAAVPAEVMLHLHDLAPAGGGAGTTAAPSSRALRWSRPKASPMTRIALASAALLLVGGAAMCTTMSAEKATPAQPPIPAPAAHPTAGSAASMWTGIDPEHAESWWILRLNDGARTAARLRQLPELALLPPEGNAWLDELATIREGGATANGLFHLTRAGRTRLFRHLQAMDRLPPAEQQRQPAYARSDSEWSQGVSLFDSNHGWVVFTSAQSPLLKRLRGLADANLHPVGGGWRMLRPDGLETGRVTPAGARLDYAGAFHEPMPQAVLDGARPSATADLELLNLLDPGKPGLPLRVMNGLTCTITGEGLRLSAIRPWAPSETLHLRSAGPGLDLSRCSIIPANAFLAGALSVRRASLADTVFARLYQTINDMPSPDELERRRLSGPIPDTAGPRQAMLARISTCLQQVDGTVVAWLEPGAPMPIATIEADMPRPAAEELITATGAVRNADGTANLLIGMVPLTLGWSNGHLVCTTNPGGIASIDRSGGFLSQPEIVRALAALPNRQPQECLLARPAALVGAVAPFVGMFAPDWRQRVADYQRRLEAAKAYGFLTVDATTGGLQVEAAGVLSLAAAGIFGVQAASGMQGLHRSN